jgi:hypothetical protein
MDVVKVFFSCLGHLVSQITATYIASKFEVFLTMMPSGLSKKKLNNIRQPTWAGYGWFWYYISPYAQAPEMIVPSKVYQTYSSFHNTSDYSSWPNTLSFKCY